MNWQKIWKFPCTSTKITNTEIKYLLYADDLFLLSPTSVNFQKKSRLQGNNYKVISSGEIDKQIQNHYKYLRIKKNFKHSTFYLGCIQINHWKHYMAVRCGVNKLNEIGQNGTKIPLKFCMQISAKVSIFAFRAELGHYPQLLKNKKNKPLISGIVLEQVTHSPFPKKPYALCLKWLQRERYLHVSQGTNLNFCTTIPKWNIVLSIFYNRVISIIKSGVCLK